MESESCTGSVGGSPGDGGDGGTTTEREGEREETLGGGGGCRGGKLRERAAAHSRERERETCGGYKEKEEQGLKLEEEGRERVVRVGDLQINKTSRLP